MVSIRKIALKSDTDAKTSTTYIAFVANVLKRIGFCLLHASRRPNRLIEQVQACVRAWVSERVNECVSESVRESVS